MYVKDPDGIRVELIEAGTDLDANPRDPAGKTGHGLVGEFSHVAVHVRDLEPSLGFTATYYTSLGGGDPICGGFREGRPRGRPERSHV